MGCVPTRAKPKTLITRYKGRYVGFVDERSAPGVRTRGRLVELTGGIVAVGGPPKVIMWWHQEQK